MFEYVLFFILVVNFVSSGTVYLKTKGSKDSYLLKINLMVKTINIKSET